MISVIILTKNESANLPTCLFSLKKLQAKVYIVDSGSVDDTVAIAREFGCEVYEHPFKNYAEQLNWAITNLPIDTPWVMRLDADERLTPELVTEINTKLPKTSQKVSGYQLKRRVYFLGRWIKHGGYYPTWLLRIWRNGLGLCEQRWMDEHIVLSEGEILSLQYDIIDENKKGLTFWTDKHNHYADREVKDMLSQDGNGDPLLEKQSYSQARQRRWLKKNLYGSSPLFFRAFIYFLLRYIFGLGFLDGKQGLIFHFLQGFWYRFLVDAKIYEFQKQQLTDMQANKAKKIKTQV
ncbi:putative glycosyl transferase [[Synechococcus] sp. NIES-970]|nr:putative glycosyl transferase [[Synechococcus] sp. NIES-970]